jgi:hypothetical protein
MDELRKANSAEDALMHSKSATNSNARKKRKVKVSF